MQAAFFILLLGALSISAGHAACSLRHPQQHFCDADFAMKLTIQLQVQRSDIKLTRLYMAKILDSWKRGPSSGEIQLYISDFFKEVTVGRKYVVTGTRKNENGRKYWSHGECDYMIAWDEMSDEQKAGFQGTYAAQCGECTVPRSSNAPSAVTVHDMENNDYSEAQTYWTPTGCYYNPLQTRQYAARKGSTIKDCEDVYGLCQRNRAGECQWKMTTEYEDCFRNRDAFVVVESADFALTDISQCDVYTSRRKKLTCRRRFTA